ncbi:MAG: integrase core domain-containing protein [Saprospiraceae bacterium]
MISLAENGDPLKNELAERMNGIFEDNFALDTSFLTFEQAQQAVEKAVKYYNSLLPHSSVYMLIPIEAHYKIGELKKHWMWYWREKQDAKKQLELKNEKEIEFQIQNSELPW